MKNKNVMVRTNTAGVFAGVLKSHKGSEVVLKNARRIYYWTGAATLSQLSQQGTSSPETCKFPEAVPDVTLLGVIEIIPMSKKAVDSISSVKIWSAMKEKNNDGDGHGSGDGYGDGYGHGSGYGYGDGSGYG